MFVYFWERKTECKWGRGKEKWRHRIQSRLQALSCQHEAWRGARTHGPRDHDPSWSQTFTQRSCQAPHERDPSRRQPPFPRWWNRGNNPFRIMAECLEDWPRIHVLKRLAVSVITRTGKLSPSLWRIRWAFGLSMTSGLSVLYPASVSCVFSQDGSEARAPAF